MKPTQKAKAILPSNDQKQPDWMIYPYEKYRQKEEMDTETMTVQGEDKNPKGQDIIN